MAHTILHRLPHNLLLLVLHNRATIVNIVTCHHALWIIPQETNLVGFASALAKTSCTILLNDFSWTDSVAKVLSKVIATLVIGHHLFKRYALVCMLLLSPIAILLLIEQFFLLNGAL